MKLAEFRQKTDEYIAIWLRAGGAVTAREVRGSAVCRCPLGCWPDAPNCYPIADDIHRICIDSPLGTIEWGCLNAFITGYDEGRLGEDEEHDGPDIGSREYPWSLLGQYYRVLYP